ncbi:hypothetical protein E4U53_008029 [Claviceps sorghi]|nr:hypothetical protein E4U53_008029 [Claviceps sorghi]
MAVSRPHTPLGSRSLSATVLRSDWVLYSGVRLAGVCSVSERDHESRDGEKMRTRRPTSRSGTLRRSTGTYVDSEWSFRAIVLGHPHGQNLALAIASEDITILLKLDIGSTKSLQVHCRFTQQRGLGTKTFDVQLPRGRALRVIEFAPLSEPPLLLQSLFNDSSILNIRDADSKGASIDFKRSSNPWSFACAAG